MERFGIPVRRENRPICLTIILVILLLIVLLAVTIGVQIQIQHSIGKLAVTDDLNATWIGSLASYWGGILGGVISGCLTVIGVIWTIKYYKDSDAVKSRIEHMPFLMLEMNGHSDLRDCELDLYKIESDKLKEDNAKEKILYYKFKLQNIGQGFANTLVVHTEQNLGGIAYNHLIQVSNSNAFCLEIHFNKNIPIDEAYFAVSFIDCMTNEYIQFYGLQLDNSNLSEIDIEQGYPKFIGQTHKICN